MKRRWALPFIIAFLVEIFVFNYKSIESFFFPAVKSFQVNTSGMVLLEGAINEYTVTRKKDVFFEMQNINASVKNVYLSFEQKDNPSRVFRYQVFATDAANGNYLSLPQAEYSYKIKETQYLRLYLVGESQKIRVYLWDLSPNDIIVLHDLNLNVLRPFMFRWYRYILLVILCVLWMMFNPSSTLYKERLDFRVVRHRWITAFIIILHLLYFSAFTCFSAKHDWKKTSWLADLQYNYLADSLINGHLYLEMTPPESLNTASNPYDPGIRNEIMRKNNESYAFDFAYYKGKYYCYFGIIPEILFYLPYQILTGRWLSTAKLIGACSIAFVFVVFFFVYQIIERYCKSISVGMYLLLASCFIAASGAVYCAHFPTIYVVPFFMGMLFSLAGAGLWLKVSNCNSQRLNSIQLFIGSLLVALVMGCRPQMAIVLFWAFPIFNHQISDGLFFTRHSWKNTFIVFLPFVAIGTLIALYNYCRFGNPFNFGATYNLTALDMTHRGFIFERLKLGFFEFLFQPLHILPKFPYLKTLAGMHNMVSDYQGLLCNEPYLGGFFMLSPIAFYVFQIHNCKKRLFDMNLWGFCIICLLFALIIIVVDIQMVGMTMRYFSDFSIFVMTATIFILLARFEQESDLVNLNVLLMLSVFTMAINYFSPLASGRLNDLRFSAPSFWVLIKYTIFNCMF